MSYWGEGLWGQYGWGGGEAFATLSVDLPAFTFDGRSASYLHAIDLPALTFEGVSALYLNAITLPNVEAAFALSNVISLNVTLPAITFEGRTSLFLEPIILPPVEFHAIRAAQLNPITLPFIEVDFKTGNVLSVKLQAIEGHFTSTFVYCGMEVQLPSIRFYGTLYQSGLGQLTVTLPTIKASFHGSGNIHGNLTISLPSLQMYATMKSTTILASVVSTKDGALTKYSNYDFNSFATIAGVHLGAGATGLVGLYGDDDKTVDIAASFQTGDHDAGVKNVKWMPNVVVTMKSDGVVKVRSVMDGVQKAQKSVYSTASTFMPKNVKTDKGPEGVNVGMQMENYLGSKFEVSSLEAILELTKKVGK